MKKIIFGLLVLGVGMVSCRKDLPNPNVEVEVDAGTQNAYDDQAIAKFLQENYLDSRGNIKAFDTKTSPDSAHVKLADLNPITLPSGTVYIVKTNAQPNPGKVIGVTDSIKIMENVMTYKALKGDDGIVGFGSSYPFRNNTTGSGMPDVDPAYYYVKKAVLDNATTDAAKQRSFYEISGFGEALRKFMSYQIPDTDNYNLQGVIIVPSRAAFGKNPHFNYSGISFKDRSFIFNFQMYNTYTRVVP